MKKKILLLMGIFTIGIINAQIGINTQSPQGVFHIDGKGNTNGVNNTIDDFIIDANGNVGVGTSTPKAKMDIMGSVIINDGNAVKDLILTSDNLGNAAWKEFDRSRGIAHWTGKATNITFTATDIPIINTTHSVSDPMGMGFSTSNGTNNLGILTVPTGTYIIILDFDVNVQEYGVVRIKNNSNNSSFFSAYYIEQLTGASFLYKFTQPTPISIVANYRNAPPLTRYSVVPYNSANVTFTITFISVTK